MKTSRRLVLIVFAALLCAGTARASNAQPASAAFGEAAKAAGASIRAEDVVTHAGASRAITIAPLTTWERVPATALRDGVDFAFAHFSRAAGDLPAGHYTLRASADVSKTGTFPATVQLIDKQRKVAGTLEAIVQVHSLTIPEQASTRRSFVTISGAPDQKEEGSTHIVVCCPNGYCVEVP